MTAPDPKTDLVAALRHHALRLFTLEELQAMDQIARRNFLVLLEKRLSTDGPPPTLEELQGIAELALDHLWHPALGRVR